VLTQCDVSADGTTRIRSTSFSTEVPSNWQIRVGAGGITGAIDIGPEAWLEPGFYEDYWPDEPNRARLASRGAPVENPCGRAEEPNRD
jgi:hypothetical protein